MLKSLALAIGPVRRLYEHRNELKVRLEQVRKDYEAALDSVVALGLQNADEQDLGFGFDADYYRQRYPDARSLTAADALLHFVQHGHDEGRFSSEIGARELLVPLVPVDRAALEIGPFGAPQLQGPQVRFADYLSTEQLKARAPAHGFDPERCPCIDYVLKDVSLDAIPERFAAVFSSHCIEHQPDLIRHLQDVATVLEPSGRYYLIIPDMRYCFDHFLPPSNILGVLAAHGEKRRFHSLGAVVGAFGLTTHNDAVRHWAGDHGVPSIRNDACAVLAGAVEEHQRHAERNEYLDVHAWQFMPRSFHEICQQLFDMRLSALRPVATSSTMKNRQEFCSVLEKVER